MKTLSLIFFLSLLSFSFVFGNEEIKLDENSPINVRLSDEKVYDKYLNDKEFDYTHEIVKTPITLWDKILNWIMKMISKLFGYGMKTPELQYIFVILVISLVVFLLLKSDIVKLFVRNRKRAELDYKTENEDIRKLNVDNIIKEAIINKNFKRAVRYLYLKLLKELDKRELILWKINKTNRDYANELAKRNLKKEFKELSLYYEYVWYGDFEISETGFENIHKRFKNQGIYSVKN